MASSTSAIAALEGKFTALAVSVNARADATDKKIDALDKRIDGLDSRRTTMNGEIKALREVVLDMKTMQKTMLWALASIGPLIPVGLTLAKAFHWI